MARRNKQDDVVYNKKYLAEHPLIKRNERLLREYKISLKDYDILSEQQKGVCAICGCKPKRKNSKFLSIDHNHRTGKVRGLLCDKCNMMVGVYEQIHLRNKIIAYLEQE